MDTETAQIINNVLQVLILIITAFSAWHSGRKMARSGSKSRYRAEVKEILESIVSSQAESNGSIVEQTRKMEKVLSQIKNLSEGST